LRQAQLVEEGRERQLALHPVEGDDRGDGERQVRGQQMPGAAEQPRTAGAWPNSRKHGWPGSQTAIHSSPDQPARLAQLIREFTSASGRT
jgi:hypothetical protein